MSGGFHVGPFYAFARAGWAGVGFTTGAVIVVMHHVMGGGTMNDRSAFSTVIYCAVKAAQESVSSEKLRISTSSIKERTTIGRKAADFVLICCATVPIGAWLVADLGRRDQAPTCGRSGREASAVRGRAFDLSPGPAGSVWLAGARSSHLTPARWQAKTWHRQGHGPNGSGGAVPDGTTPELWQNHQHIELTYFFVRFWKFRLPASRAMCASVCAYTRAYMCARNAGTLELHLFIYRLEIDRGSVAVLVRFSPEPLRLDHAEIGGFPWFLNKLAGGYSADLPLGLVQVRRSTVMRWRPAQTFGFGADRAGADRPVDGLELVDLGDLTRCGWNGGFLRFSVRASGDVGTMMLERCAQGIGNAWFSGRQRKPVRLMHRRADRQGGLARAPSPPHAPIAAAPPPSTLAREACRILTGPLGLGPMRSTTKGRKVVMAGIGSGWGRCRRASAQTATGRGECGSAWGSAPLRQGHARAGNAHVN